MSIEIETKTKPEDVKVNLTLVSQQIDQLVQQYNEKRVVCDCWRSVRQSLYPH